MEDNTQIALHGDVLLRTNLEQIVNSKSKTICIILPVEEYIERVRDEANEIRELLSDDSGDYDGIFDDMFYMKQRICNSVMRWLTGYDIKLLKEYICIGISFEERIKEEVYLNAKIVREGSGISLYNDISVDIF